VQARLEVRLPTEIETIMYRIVQEALNYVAKHAQANEVALILAHDAEGVCLVIKDDGTGFNTSGPVDPRAVGLLGMRERAGLVAGTVEIDSGPEGTTVRVRIPV
jgi:signal transduction histidine kinase